MQSGLEARVASEGQSWPVHVQSMCCIKAPAKGQGWAEDPSCAWLPGGAIGSACCI